MDDPPVGPCLPHCYRCPKTVVYASKVAMAMTVGLIVFLIGTACPDADFVDRLELDQARAYRRLQERGWKYLIGGTIVGAVVLDAWRPYKIL